MDYEKAYKEALERAEVLIAGETNTSDALFYLNDIKSIFPELQESVDEKIRKVQLDYWRSVGGKEWHGVPIQETIAWLEKQGEQKVSYTTLVETGNGGINALVTKELPINSCNEQKPDDKVEPKFKVGDWIINNVSKDIFLIKSVNSGYCSLEDTKGNIYVPCLPFESDFHLWTIEDAKNGDVLVCENGWTCIFNCLNDNLFCSHCFMDDEGWFCEDGGQAHTLDNRICGEIYPATKEQRDLLFQKMYEAGYEFDFNKKELKKTPEESLGISSEKYNEIVNQCIFGEEKKSKWTEKDECMMKSIMADIEYVRSWHKYDMDAHYNEELAWLKSLKQRLIWQEKSK